MQFQRNAARKDPLQIKPGPVATVLHWTTNWNELEPNGKAHEESKAILRGYQLCILCGFFRLVDLSRGELFFVTVNLLRPVPNLSTQDFPFLVQAIEDSRQRHHFLFCGYVLMPDHWHALIWPRFPVTISGVVKDVKYVSCCKLNRSRQGKGSIWQHQFWDRFVRNNQELRLRLDYMHHNPVRKGLVRRPEDWSWSSYNNFALDPKLMATCPIQIDRMVLPDSYRG